MKNEYVLKSTKEDIAKAIKMQSEVKFEEEDLKEAVDNILLYCPKELYPNIDEIVNEEEPSEILFKFVSGNGSVVRRSLKYMQDHFWDLSYITILVGISLHCKNETGFWWLDYLCYKTC